MAEDILLDIFSKYLEIVYFVICLQIIKDFRPELKTMLLIQFGSMSPCNQIPKYFEYSVISVLVRYSCVAQFGN